MLDSSDQDLQKLAFNIVAGIGGNASLHVLSYMKRKPNKYNGVKNDMMFYSSVILTPTIGDVIIVKRRKEDGTSGNDKGLNKLKNSRKRRASSDTSKE